MGSNPIAEEITDTHYLTTIEWNGMSEMFRRGELETGIRAVRDGKVLPDTFELIQHGWHSYEDAHEVIKKALHKKWDVSRISDFMDFLKGRYRK